MIATLHGRPDRAASITELGNSRIAQRRSIQEAAVCPAPGESYCLIGKDSSHQGDPSRVDCHDLDHVPDTCFLSATHTFRFLQGTSLARNPQPGRELSLLL